MTVYRDLALNSGECGILFFQKAKKQWQEQSLNSSDKFYIHKYKFSNEDNSISPKRLNNI